MSASHHQTPRSFLANFTKSIATNGLLHCLADVLVIILVVPLAAYLRTGDGLTLLQSHSSQAYALTGIVSAGLAWHWTGLSGAARAYANWRDLGLVAVVSISAVFGALLGGFLIGRLDGVPRSLPLYHGTLLLFGLGGIRVLTRALENWSHVIGDPQQPDRIDVLLLGRTELAAVYADTARAQGARHLHIAGILTDEATAVGTLINSTYVLGRPAEITTILKQLRVHGVFIGRIILLSPQSALDEQVATMIAAEAIDVYSFHDALIPSG